MFKVRERNNKEEVSLVNKRERARKRERENYKRLKMRSKGYILYVYRQKMRESEQI